MASNKKSAEGSRRNLPENRSAQPSARHSRKKILIAAVILAAVILLAVAVTFLVMYLTSDRPIAQTEEEKRVVGTCGGMEVPYEELRYVALAYRDNFEKTYGENVWDDPERYDELYQTVLSVLRNNYAIFKACEYYRIDYNDSALTDAVQKQIEAVRKEAGSRDAYLAQLNEYYLTDHLLRFTLLAEQAESELFCQIRDFIGKVTVNGETYSFYGDYTSPADYAEFFNSYLTEEDSKGTRRPSSNLIPVDYLFIQNDSGEDPEDNLALATRYRDELLALSPEKREQKLGEIIGSDVNCAYTGVGPYFIVRGTYTEDFWNGVSTLSNEGDVSEVISTTAGYYVAVRVAYEEGTLLTQVQTLMKEYQSALIESYIEEVKSGLTVELNDYGKSLNLLEIRMSK